MTVTEIEKKAKLIAGRDGRPYRCFFLREGGKLTLLTVGSHRIVDGYKKD
jgi:hypothetical protein